MTDIRKKAEAYFKECYSGYIFGEKINDKDYDSLPSIIEERCIEDYEAGYAASEQGRRWRKCSEEMPKSDGRYLIVYKQGRVRTSFIADLIEGHWASLLPDVEITDWMPITLPQGES